MLHIQYICNYFWLTSGKGSPKFGSYCNSNSVQFELFLLCSPLNQQTCESWGWKYSFYLTFWKKNYSWILVSTLLLLFLFIHTWPLNLEINKKKTVTWINKENTFLGTIGFFSRKQWYVSGSAIGRRSKPHAQRCEKKTGTIRLHRSLILRAYQNWKTCMKCLWNQARCRTRF